MKTIQCAHPPHHHNGFSCLKFLVWFLYLSLKSVSAKPKYYFLSLFPSLETSAQQIIFGVRQSSFRGQLLFTLQLHL